MNRVKNKVNIFFTTSYVIILGLAVPVVSNSSATPQVVSTSQPTENTPAKSNGYGDTVKVITIDVNYSENDDQQSPLGLASPSHRDPRRGYISNSLQQSNQDRHSHSDQLRQLATVRLLN